MRHKLQQRQRQSQSRLQPDHFPDCSGPIFRGCPYFRFDLSTRCVGTAYAGIPLLLKLAQEIGLVNAIDDRLHLLKIHMPYHESDHVLNFAINALCGATAINDIELRRNDPAFLDAVGAQRIPDPTTAGDFCRRFSIADIDLLQDIFNDTRVSLWKQQPADFFNEARIDADGSLIGTGAECKRGIDIAYDGTWGYHLLLLSLANTREVLWLVNRSGNRPSHEGAAAAFDRMIALCLGAGFRRVLLRGDTDFSQTEHLDRWNAESRVRFIFGYDAKQNLKDLAEALTPEAWHTLERPPRWQVKTEPRERPDRVKDEIVKQREFETLRLEGEDVAEFPYQPTACKTSYRMVVVRKRIARTKGEVRLFEEDEYRYFFYITNDRASEPAELVFLANDRCHQENLIEQLKNGAKALRAPLDTLESNCAYMVMTALAWNLKSWSALRLEETGRWREKHRAEKKWLINLEFKAYLSIMVTIPCQIVRGARGMVFRILSYHPHMGLFFRLAAALRC